MGQLLFCSHALAKKPYDIESASLNIYSLEEMSYYLIHNAEFVEMDFVGRTFCDWVRTGIFPPCRSITELDTLRFVPPP